MWKAFEEMEQLGWVTGKRPKMIAIQASGCAPVAKAYREGANTSQMFENAATFAAGLRVPKPYGDYIILDVVRQSGGTVIDLPDETILESLLDWSRHEGLLLSPEGASATAAYDQLIETGFLKPSERVVIFNTGAGLKYVDMIADAMGVSRPEGTKLPERVPVGGIITPQ
jgi:threonine synthase